MTFSQKTNIFIGSYEEKQEEKDNGFPAYAIALIVVIGAALVAGAAFLTYKLLAKKSVDVISMGTSENPEIIKKYDGDLEKVQQSTTSP